MADTTQHRANSNTVFEGYITEEEYAKQRGVSIRTCQRGRAMRQSPPYVLVGKTVYYRIEAVRDWLLQQERSEESFQKPARRGGRQ